jgi:hypothetical protein
VEIPPTPAGERRFALKGGTVTISSSAICRAFPLNIHLTWLPVGEFANDAREIAAALTGIGEKLRSGSLRLQVQASGTELTGLRRLIASRGRSRVQVDSSVRQSDQVEVWCSALDGF